MTTKRSTLTLAAGLVAVLSAGAVLASPELAAHLFAFFSDPSAAFLAWGPAVLALQRQHAAEVDGMTKIAALLGERDLTADEQAAYDGHKAKAESLKARISMAMEAEAAAAGLAPVEPAPAAAGRSEGAVTLPAGARIAVANNADADPNRGFRSMGDYLMAVRGATVAARQGRMADQRLSALVGGGINAAAPTTYGSESSGEDGGYLVPPGFGTQIFQLSLEEDALLPMTDNMPITSNTMALPKDETTPWGADGVRAYWEGEATAATATKPKVGRSEYRLRKLMALVPMTEELMADGVALGAYFEPACARSIRWKTDEAILWGAAGEQPLGAFASACAVSQSKESGQANGTIVAENVVKMVSRLPAGSYRNAVWMVNNDALPQLFVMKIGDTPIWLPVSSPNGAISGSPYGTLLGRPVMVTQHAKSIGTAGDIMLADLRQYRAITKAGGIQTATSMHLYFDADAVAFRATFRVDGAPKLAAPINPQNGSVTLSPFVTLEAR